MYNLLVKIRKLNIMIKILMILGIFIFAFGGPALMCLGVIMVFVFVICMVKSKGTNPERYKAEIKRFTAKYDELREYVKGAKGTMINIGSYVFEYKGQVCYASSYISLYAKNLPNSVVEVFPSADCRKIEGDVYFQFPIRKKYSKVQKITIILAVLEYITENYPDDKVYFDEKLPIGMSVVGFNTILDVFQ